MAPLDRAGSRVVSAGFAGLEFEEMPGASCS